jgi:tetratricopeptide (TPR) repeat protein
MHRSALFVLAVALASACAGPKRPLTATEIDARAEALAVRSRWQAARQLVERGLAEARARGDRAGEARLLLRRGRTLSEETRHRGGDRAPAHADLTAARGLAEAAGDRALLAASLDALGLDRYTGWYSSQDPADLAGADELFRQALALREPGGDSAGLADSHFHVGLVHQMRGELDAARRRFETSLAVAERIRDELRMSYAHRHLGYLAELGRDLAAAEDGYRRSLELRERAGGGVGVAAAILTLAELRYRRDGDAERVWPMLVRARALATEAQSPAYVAIASAAMGRVRRDQGNCDEALDLLAAAASGMEAIGSAEDVPENLEAMALIDLLRDQPARALAEIERGLARRQSPRFAALAVLARSRAGAEPAAAVPEGGGDPVATSRLALARGDLDAALDAALEGDDPIPSSWQRARRPAPKHSIAPEPPRRRCRARRSFASNGSARPSATPRRACAHAHAGPASWFVVLPS